jgi:hypothetical protein
MNTALKQPDRNWDRPALTTIAIKVPTQRRLPLKLEIEAPMMSIPSARDILHLDVDSLADLIADRSIAWAWNIGLGKRRAEIRILTKCLRGYQATSSSCNLSDKGEDEIIGYILAREKKPWIEGVSLKFLLACENSHIVELVSAGELAVMPGTSWQPGPGGSPRIECASVVEFLKRRREPK